MIDTILHYIFWIIYPLYSLCWILCHVSSILAGPTLAFPIQYILCSSMWHPLSLHNHQLTRPSKSWLILRYSYHI